MRILFVTAGPLTRLRPRLLGFAGRLAERHDVTLVCSYRSPGDPSEDFGIDIPAAPVYARRRDLLGQTASLLFHPGPVEVAYSPASQLRQVVEAEVTRGNVGLVHVDSLAAAGVLTGLPVPLVWDAAARRHTHDLSPERRSASIDKSWAPDIFAGTGGIEEWRMSVYLRHLLGACQGVLVESPLDRARLLASCDPGRSRGEEAATTYRERIWVVSSGVDLDYFSRTGGDRQAARLVFCGRMDDPANIAAADLLVSRILPLVWRQRPDVQLTIAGSSPTRQIRAYAGDARITVTGYVQDMRPYLAGAAIAVNPLPAELYPAGIRRPLLEALAMGTPLVVGESSTTDPGLIPGRDVMMASSISRFAQLVERLLDDAELRSSLAYHGHSYVRRYHSLDLQIRRLEAVYSEVSGHNFTLAASQHLGKAASPLASGW